MVAVKRGQQFIQAGPHQGRARVHALGYIGTGRRLAGGRLDSASGAAGELSQIEKVVEWGYWPALRGAGLVPRPSAIPRN